MKIRDSYGRILGLFPLKLNEQDSEFAKALLLFLLESYEELIPSFESASEKYSDSRNYSQLSEQIGFSSDAEFRQMMFLREIMNTVNNLKEAGDILQAYPGNPQVAKNRLRSLFRLLPAENGE